MQISSGSDSKVEINPYWSKITINKLQGLGNPKKSLPSDDDEMPDLEPVSEISIIFILTPANSACSTNSEKGSIEESLAEICDIEMLDLVVDEGEDGLTTFDAAMLVNMGAVEGTQTKLYDSGASRHMSPYRDHFENYIPIIPKSITAADKHYFQAIGKGDLQVKIPNGTHMTTILLKDVLHCPAIGLTLVSIGKLQPPVTR